MKHPPLASDRVRLRLQEELKARDVSQRELADLLSRQTDEVWTQSKVGKVLNGDVELKVDDADAIARAVKLFLTEAVRDRGLEFYAEMTPAELRILDILRHDAQTRHLIYYMCHVPEPAMDVIEKVKRPRRGRPLNSELKKRGA